MGGFCVKVNGFWLTPVTIFSFFYCTFFFFSLISSKELVYLFLFILFNLMAISLDWEQLKEDGCPACGMAMEITDKEYICTNHRGNPFKIPKKRAIEIKRDLAQNDDCTLSWI